MAVRADFVYITPMWDWLKSLDLGRWWKVAIATGLVIAVIAIGVKDRADTLIGLGMISCGFGEWINHTMETTTKAGGTLTTFERKNRTLGLAFAILGLLLIGGGLGSLILRD
jgi:hypothetical protein